MMIKERLASYNWTYIIIGTILTVAIIGSIVLSILTYAITTADEKTISTHQDLLVTIESQLVAMNTELGSLSDQISDSEGQVASINDQQALSIAIMQDELATANEQITSLISQLNSVVLQVTSLSNDVYSDNAAVLTMQTQLSSITSELSALRTTTTSLQNKITSLENKLNTLKATVDKLTAPVTNSVALFSAQTISQSFSTQTLLYSITAPYTGYISISGTSSSSTAYIRVTNNTTSVSNFYAFGTGSVVNVMVNAGYSYSIYFGNSDTSGTITAKLSAIYFY